MFVLAMALVTAAPEQVLAGKAFEDLASQTDVECPGRQVRSITSGDLDGVQEEFEEQISRQELARLKSANDADRICAGRNGLSCPTTETLKAMERVNLMKRFVPYICSHQNLKLQRSPDHKPQ